MVTKTQIDRLLEKNLKPKEVAKIVIEDWEAIDAGREPTFPTHERNQLVDSQPPHKHRKVLTWFDAYKIINLNRKQARISSLETHRLRMITNTLHNLNVVRIAITRESFTPALMTQKEYEDKKKELWEHESNEKIPICRVISAKTDHIFYEKTGDFQGKDESISAEMYEQAENWLKDQIESGQLEPKELEKPAEKKEYYENNPFFEVAKGTKRYNWLYKTYLTGGELAKAEGSPFDYIKKFDLERYKEKVNPDEAVCGGISGIAIVQDPYDFEIDDRGWYKRNQPNSRPLLDKIAKAPLELLEELRKLKNQVSSVQSVNIDSESLPDSVQGLYNALIETTKSYISAFKAHKLIAEKFGQVIGTPVSKAQMMYSEMYIKEYIIGQYNVEVESLRKLSFSEEATWRLNEDSIVKLEEIDYEEIPISEDTLEEWGGAIGQLLGEDWMDRNPGEVEVDVR